MSASVTLLRFVAKSLLNAVSGGIAGDLVCDVLPEVAQKTWGKWSKEKDEGERQAEVAALAEASDEEVRRLVQQAVQEAAKDQPEEVRQQLTGYLMQVPATIRHSFRRPTDPTGKTVPTGLVLRKASDLLSLLPSRQPRFRPGQQPLANVDLELVELLGVGGFGEVWKAKNPNRRHAGPVALKFCLDPEAAEVLRNEVDVLDRVMSQGRHPGIVPLQHTYLSAETPCLEYEYIEGGDLAGLIDEWYRSGNPPTTAQARAVLLHVAEAVAYAHELSPPIVHRDLKPANVLVRRDQDGKTHFLVSDFGLGGLADAQVTQHTRRSGKTDPPERAAAGRGAYTPLYASPQQVRGESPDPRDDVYALGVIWYQLLTGDLASGAPTGLAWPQQLKSRGVSAAEVDLLASCFDARPDNRPASAAVLVERLWGLGVPPRKRRPSLAGVALLVVAVAAVISLFFVDYTGLWERIRPAGGGEAEAEEKTPAKAEKPAKKELEPDIANSIGMRLKLIRPGRFTMGSPATEKDRDRNEGPAHEVSISQPYYLGVFEVTQAEYHRVMQTNPSAFSADGKKSRAVAGLETERFPVENVTRAQAEEFCRRLSDRAEEKQAGRSYRLPTEAEWEYACRAGTSTPFSFGDVLTSKQANFDGTYPYGTAVRGNHLGRPEVVGKHAPNAWGLYDLHGNVREWCADDYREFYDREPAAERKEGVMRGGCWADFGKDCRSAWRKEGDPAFPLERTGFRVVCIVGRTAE
jgi:formylglycine-generating enzyme required for sulfatase activity